MLESTLCTSSDEALQIPYVIMSASDMNLKCKDFATANLTAPPTHWFKTLQKQLLNQGCVNHVMSRTCQAAGSEPDLGVVGSPCHPFSTQRAGRYAKDSVELHAEFKVTMRDVIQFIQIHTPKVLLSEQVAGFDKPIEKGSSHTPYQM